MLLSSLYIVATVQTLLWMLFLRRGFSAPVRPVPRPDFPVSVIVCFRNEEASLAACLEGILAQEYPVTFEVILVDDNSTDRSTEIALAYAGYDARVRVVYPGETRPGKKDALAYGIEQASYECLVLTDADCTPASNRWLLGMAGGLCGRQELALGVSPYRTDGSFLSRWQQFESFYVALKYLGFARAGLPYMGVGRNLAYTKSFYARQGGFTAHADLASGDDDLLVSAGAEADRTSTVTDPAAWTWSAPHHTWSGYLRQRQRHQSTGVHYPPGVAALLGLFALVHGLFYLLLIAAFVRESPVALTLFLARIAVSYACFAGVYGQLGADAGAREMGKERGKWVLTLLAGDFLLGPMYLYLLVGGFLPRRGW